MAGNKNSGGHNKKSERLHLLQGTYRPDRHADMSTPELPVARPPLPKGLGADAKAEWERMVTRLETAGTISIVDDAVLYQYVQLYAETEQVTKDHARIRKLSKELKDLASTLEGLELLEAIKKIVDMEFILNRQTTQLRQQHMAIRQYLVEFGMTPSARTRVKTTRPKERSDRDLAKERFFGVVSGGQS